MGEIGRDLCGLGRTPNNFLMVVCGDGVVVVDAHNATAADDLVATDDIVAVDGVVVQ